MAGKDLDLMAALGTPESPSGAPTEARAPKAKGSSYLSGKPPELRAMLMDAVDPSLSHEERAEALCRALEGQLGAAEPEAELESEEPAGPVGEGFEDY